MTKLPRIDDPKKLERIIMRQATVIVLSDRLRALVLENLKRIEKGERERLLDLLFCSSMSQNG